MTFILNILFIHTYWPTHKQCPSGAGEQRFEHGTHAHATIRSLVWIMTLGKAVWGNFCCSSKGHFSIHTAFSAENVSFSQLEDTFPAENTHSSYSDYCFSGIYLFFCLFSAHFSALFKSFCYATETEMENSSNHRKTTPLTTSTYSSHSCHLNFTQVRNDQPLVRETETDSYLTPQTSHSVSTILRPWRWKVLTTWRTWSKHSSQALHKWQSSFSVYVSGDKQTAVIC